MYLQVAKDVGLKLNELSFVPQSILDGGRQELLVNPPPPPTNTAHVLLLLAALLYVAVPPDSFCCWTEQAKKCDVTSSSQMLYWLGWTVTWDLLAVLVR